jgi:hypothetical protein
MRRTSLLIVIAGLCLAAATQPSPDALHAQAYDLMFSGAYAKARAPLDKAYNATPPAARSRALVINHAILDMTSKTYVMRAVKDLGAYLTKNRAEDEPATNLLGGALNLAAGDPWIKRGDLWQAVFKEWDRRNYNLDHSRPGWRRWGTRWISDEEFNTIKAQQQSLRQSVEDQQDRVNRASDRAASICQQQQSAFDTRTQYDALRRYLLTYNNPGQNLYVFNPIFNSNQPDANGIITGFWEADQAYRRLNAEATAAIHEYDTEARRLVELERKVIRPEWPTKFDPIDPASLEASTPPRSEWATTAPAPTNGPTPTPTNVPAAMPATPAAPTTRPAGVRGGLIHFGGGAKTIEAQTQPTSQPTSRPVPGP